MESTFFDMACKSNDVDVKGLLNGGRCMHCDAENPTFLVVITVNGQQPRDSGAACDEDCANMYIREASGHFLDRQIAHFESAIEEDMAALKTGNFTLETESFVKNIVRVRAVSRNSYKCLLERDLGMYALYKKKAAGLWTDILPLCPDDRMLQKVALEMKSWFENCETGEKYFFKV